MNATAPSPPPPQRPLDESLFDVSTFAHLEQAQLEDHRAEPARGHLGLSGIGNPDTRSVWLEWRWSLPVEFPARTLRIFRLGHLIEAEVIRLLKRTPGLQVIDRDPDTGLQWRATLAGGHAGGSMDAKLIGVREAPDVPHCFECKSSKASEFARFCKVGLKAWNPVYYMQVQAYLGAFGLARALYAVYCKDTSEIEIEMITPEPGYWDDAQMTAEHLVALRVPPPAHYQNPNRWEIKGKSMQWKAIYFGQELPAPNCRNCKWATPEPDGNARWHCARHTRDLTIEQQRAGCRQHQYLPVLLQGLATLIEDHGVVTRYATHDGTELWSADDVSQYPNARVFRSTELQALSQGGALNGAMLTDQLLRQIRAGIDGEFVTP